MKLKEDYTANYRNYGEITVPAGTRVTHRTGSGKDKNYHFVDDFRWIDKNYPAFASLLKFDARFYGINIPKEFIEDEL